MSLAQSWSLPPVPSRTASLRSLAKWQRFEQDQAWHCESESHRLSMSSIVTADSSSTPSRYSVWSSSSSDACSIAGGLITPKGDDRLSRPLDNASLDDKVRAAESGKGEAWWSMTTTSVTSIGDQNVCLDDSPTLPTVALPRADTVPSIETFPIPSRMKLSQKQVGKLAVRPPPLQDLGINQSSTSSSDPFLFDLSWQDMAMERQVVDGTETALPNRPKIPTDHPHRPSTHRSSRSPLSPTRSSRPSLPSFISTPDFTSPPPIPVRASSRKRPVPPSRGSSLPSTAQSSQIVSAPHHTPTSLPPLRPSTLTPSRPAIPVRAPSHPPPVALNTQLRSSSSIKRTVTPTLLQPISETPRDLDVSPDASWALRSPRRRPALHLSRSQPDLRRSPLDMTVRFRLRRSNSQSSNQGNFVSRDAFPEPRRDSLDLGSLRDSKRERTGGEAGRASFSDIARTFLRDRERDRPLEESPTLPCEETIGRPGMKRSPRTQSFNTKRPTGKKRPSLLALPQSWSPKPLAPRSTSEPVIVSLSSRLSFNKVDRLELPRILTDLKDVFDAPTPDLELDTWTKKEAIEAVLEAEKWTWPTPPSLASSYATVHKLRMQGEDTPGLISTSDTMDSFSPQTPSFSEFCLHGEVEWLEREKQEKREASRADSMNEGSVGSLEVSL
ncbi:hypothetical protein IAR55_006914 [Kwoniella newhampshirensis]|uniref:Uncharacterized protein n=1 Tax=Kwoniella newhampshirensis TaxID=1651941 RepID=A0AAW0YTK0_9TREE